MRRLVAIERKLTDLKSSFWKTTIADSLKIGITAGATLLATYLTGKFNQENARVTAVANAEASERMRDFREARREWVDAKSTFQNYFANAERVPQSPAPQDFMKADVKLLRQIETALIPSALAKKLDEFRVSAGEGKTKCEAAKNFEERKALAMAARVLLEQKSAELNAAFDESLQNRTASK